MPTSILEWVVLFATNIVTGALAGLISKRALKLVGFIVVLSIFNPIAVYYATAWLQSHDLTEYHAWAMLIIPMISGLGFPILLVAAVASYLLNRYKRKNSDVREVKAS